MHNRVHPGDVLEARTPVIPAPDTVWEAGHYYRSKGPTVYSAAGWSVLKQLAPTTDARMLFVDDVHAIHDVSDWERQLETVQFAPDPQPTLIFSESEALEGGYKAIETLKSLSRARRAREYKEQWICSGYSLTNKEGVPLCLLYDLGLTWKKRELGFTKAVNILPQFYEHQQRSLLRLVRKAMPKFELRVILHDAVGNYHEIFPANA